MPPSGKANDALKIDRPFWLAPAHLFKAQHLVHLGHAGATLLALFLLLRQYASKVHLRPLEGGGVVWEIPSFHFDLHHWETWAGVALLLLTALTSGLLGRAVRWRHQSVTLPRWDEAAPAKAPPPVILRYAAGLADIRAVLRFLEPAFPQKWYLSRPLDDREDQLKRILGCCPRSILLLLLDEPGALRLIGCSLIVPLTARAYWDYRNGRNDNWRLEQKDFLDHGPLLLSNYLFCYRPRYRHLLREMFLHHLVALGPKDDQRVAVIAPRMSAAGKTNMARMGGHQVGLSLQKFPLFELDLRRDDELGDTAGITLGELRKVAAAPRLLIAAPPVAAPAPALPARAPNAAADA